MEKAIKHCHGKYWGPSDKKTFLLLHGWQDNAGTFDTLIPHLPSDNSYLAIDLTGHGLSSHYPRGVFYTHFDALAVMRRIQRYFDWPRLHLMGHSLGSIFCYLFASTYNDDVDTYIALDALKPESIDVAKVHGESRKRIENLMRYDTFEAKDGRSYTESEMLDKMKKALKTQNETTCRIMMKRGTSLRDGLYKPLRDSRVKEMQPFGYTHDHNVQLAERIKCDVLVIKCKNSSYFEDKKNFYDILDIVKKNARYFEYQNIDGGHHLHLESPEVVGQVIENFLAKVGSKNC